MSRQYNQSYHAWKSLEQTVRGTRFKWRDRPLGNLDNETIQSCFSLLICILWDVLTSLSITPDPHVGRLTKWLVTTDVETSLISLKDCDSALLSCLHEGELPFTSYDSFKHCLRGASCAGGILSGFFKGRFPITGVDAPSVYSRMHQFFAFSGRVTLRDVPELDELSLHKFKENLSRVATHPVYTDEESIIIHDWCSEFELVTLPRHGNGAVAEQGVKSIDEKYYHLGPNALTRYCDSRGVPFPDDIAFISGSHCARLQVVPKSAFIKRTICMEPTQKMWIQQAVMGSIDELFRRRLSRRINLHDQTLSTDLARDGSISGELSTIDLSMASDSISDRLVCEWFRDTPLYRWLKLGRSSCIQLPDGEVIPSPLYASMGSALCFPVECIVFAAICEASIREQGGNPRRSRYRVYGDDIIIETKYVPRLLERLQANGFIPNPDKSFYNTTGTFMFREACGGEFLNGVDVSAFRCPRGLKSIRQQRSELSSWMCIMIDIANECFFHSLPLTRGVIIKEIMTLPRHLRPLFTEEFGAEGIFSPSATNHHLNSRWDPKLQRRVFKRGVTTCESQRGDEDIRYFETLRVNSCRCDSVDSLSEPVSTGRPKRAILSGKWTQ